MTRPQVGPRSVSSSSGLHNYFLRSTLQQNSVESQTSSTTSSPACNQRSASPVPATRTLKKKKSSIWSMFSRSSRKTSASASASTSTIPTTLKEQQQRQISLPMTLANMSSMSIDIPSQPQRQLQHMMQHSCEDVVGGGSRSLRSQRSMNTIGSGTHYKTLRNAKSQFSLRLPAGIAHFDTDSIFSDDSAEGEVSVSWITSTGRRKAGLEFADDDDDEMIDFRR